MTETSALANTANSKHCTNDAGVQFVTEQLKLGITYCDMALGASSAPMAERLQKLAKRSFESAVLRAENLSFGEQEWMEVEAKATELRARLVVICFDVFAIFANGIPRLLGSGHNLEQAEQLLLEQPCHVECTYVFHSQTTGNRTYYEEWDNVIEVTSTPRHEL